MAGCDSTLWQHMRTCASILAGRVQHEDHKSWRAWFSRCLRTAAAIELGDTDIHFSQPGSDGFHILLPRRQPRPPEADIEELSFNLSGTHLAVICDEWKPHYETRDTMALYLLHLASGESTCVTYEASWLRTAWAPSGRCLAALSASRLFIVQTSSSMRELAMAGENEPGCLAWRPDSRQLLHCNYGDLYAVGGGREQTLGLVELRGWRCQAAAYLPCRWHGRWWAALALYKDEEQGHVALKADDGKLVSSLVLPAGGCCKTLAASAQHVALCSPAKSFSDGAVHMFIVQASDQRVLLVLHGVILVHSPFASCALSPCGVWMALVNAEPDLIEGFVRRDISPHNLMLQLVRVDAAAASAPASPALPISSQESSRRPSLQWAVDSTGLGMPGIGQSRVYMFCG